MHQIKLNDDFLNYLLANHSIEKKELIRLLDDISGALDSTVQDYIQERHFTLQKEGKRNSEIYSQLQKEIKNLRFVAPDLSVRQIRRIIYG